MHAGTRIRDQDRSATGRPRVLHLLDAFRGLAALAVVQRHTAWLFATEAWPSTYLAVDLFFVLSGFVIAYSYEDRLGRSMGWGRFMLLRVIRLYPLYLVGLGLGMLALAGHELQRPDRAADWPLVGQALLSAALMLPNWGVPAVIGPRWSLTYELVANAAYAAVARRLTPALLCATCLLSGAALILLVRATGTLDAGWDLDQAPTALARVGFSFFAGVLLFRVHDRRIAPTWLVAAVAGAALLAAAAWTVPMAGAQRVELALVFLGFPALTLVGARFDVHGRWAQLCGALGVTSYAIYVVHQPAAVLYEALLRRVLPSFEALAPFAGWSLLAILLAGCWSLDRWYDRPVRRRLVAALG